MQEPSGDFEQPPSPTFSCIGRVPPRKRVRHQSVNLQKRLLSLCTEYRDGKHDMPALITVGFGCSKLLILAASVCAINRCFVIVRDRRRRRVRLYTCDRTTLACAFCVHAILLLVFYPLVVVLLVIAFTFLVLSVFAVLTASSSSSSKIACCVNKVHARTLLS